MGDDWDFGSIWGGITGAASDIWSGITGAAGDIWSGISGIFGGGDSGDLGGAWPDVSWPEIATPIPGGVDEPQAGPADVAMGGDVMNGGGMVQAAWPAAAAAGAISLGALLARTFGRAAGGAVFTAANGVRVRMAQLWPLVRRYGAEAVAGGLGIGLGALGTLLATPEAIHGRGISARDVKTTRRTLKTIRKLYSMMPKRTVSLGGGGGYRRSYRSYRRRY